MVNRYPYLSAYGVHPRPVFPRSFYDHALRQKETLGNVAIYIWENPVRAGIVPCVSAYKWSGSLVWPNWKDLARTGAGGDKPHPYAR